MAALELRWNPRGAFLQASFRLSARAPEEAAWLTTHMPTNSRHVEILAAPFLNGVAHAVSLTDLRLLFCLRLHIGCRAICRWGCDFLCQIGRALHLAHGRAISCGRQGET